MSASGSEGDDFTVEKILGSKGTGKKLLYQVKWVGFPVSEATWEPPANCEGCEDLIASFVAAAAKKAAPKKKKPPAAAAAGKKKPAATKAAQPKLKGGKVPAAAAAVAATGGGNHKYKHADGRLDRKGLGYYDLKGTWASSGESQKAHSGLADNLSGTVMPKAFKKVDSVTGRVPEKLLGKRVSKSGATEYKVKWVGLNSAHATWIDVETCTQTLEGFAQEILPAYEQYLAVEEEWVGEPLPAEVAAARWPKRERPGVLNYEQVIVNGLKVSVGDPVRTMADTDYYDDKGGAEDDIENTWVGTVEELWGWENSTFGDMEDKFFAVRWFWRAKDTVCKDMATRQPGVAFAMDPRRIFVEKLRQPDPTDYSDEYMTTGRDDQPVSCIMGTCKVVHKQSGQPIEDDVDYFYDMSYDEEFCTFEDVNEFTPPLLQHPEIGSHNLGSDSMPDDGFLNILKVFCLQKAMPGNYNLPLPLDAPVMAPAAVEGRRTKAQPKKESKKALITARINDVLHCYVKAALANSPDAQSIQAAVVQHGWDKAQQKFVAELTASDLRALGVALDGPAAETSAADRACANYGSPGYGTGKAGTASTAPTQRSKSLMCLDLYCGAGGLSFMDGKDHDAEVHTQWAVDIDPMAIQTFGVNNPKTETFVLGTDDFLFLCKRWDEVVGRYGQWQAKKSSKPKQIRSKTAKKVIDVRLEPLHAAGPAKKGTSSKGAKKRRKAEDDGNDEEVDEYVATALRSDAEMLQFLVVWEGRNDENEWISEGQLAGSCDQLLAAFVKEKVRSKAIPRPGEVDVLTGGPPCQGVSGYNMCRNEDDPLSDPKNRQMPLFFEVVRFLRPRYVLMENVPDMFKFVNGIYGRFSMSQLIELGYQGRIGFMPAGKYGVPQYRLRCFLWGALSGEPLPGFPMPSHRVVRCQQHVPTEMKTNEVRAPPKQLIFREVRLKDAISDLPKVAHDFSDEVTAYPGLPANASRFMKTMRTPPPASQGVKSEPKKLFNHTPQPLPPDDLYRAEHIPLKKGACWRDLGILSADKTRTTKPFTWFPLDDAKVRNKPDNNSDPRSSKLPAGGGRSSDKCIVPQYAINKAGATTHAGDGRSKGDKSLARMWWDEIFTTCIGRMMIHSHKNMHPGQFRSFSAREYARAQGFPDWYKIEGSASKYCNKKYDHTSALVPLNKFQQIGNAVSPQLAKAMGTSLRMALSFGTPRHAVVKWFDDPKPSDDGVYDWRPNEKDKEDMSASLLSLAGPTEEDGFGSDAEEEVADDDDVVEIADTSSRPLKKSRNGLDSALS